jgi:VanZ family protein
MKPESERVPMQFPEKLRFLLPHAAFVGCIIGLAILALLPAESMTRSFLGGHVEHFVAYLGTTMVMGLAFRQRPRLALRCALLAGYAAILEVAQAYSPDRHASFHDFVFSASGVAAGGLLLWMALPRLSTWPRIDRQQ